MNAHLMTFLRSIGQIVTTLAALLAGGYYGWTEGAIAGVLALIALLVVAFIIAPSDEAYERMLDGIAGPGETF